MKDRTLKFTAVASAITKPNKSVLNAIQSWRAISGSVFLFNLPSDLGGEAPINVTYVTPAFSPSSLKEMIVKLARETAPQGTGILVHEDVFIQPEATATLTVSKDKSLGNAWAATSKAKEYSPQGYAATGAFTQTSVGSGYYAFITTGPGWQAMAIDCPGSLKAGTQDAWEWVAQWCLTHIQQNRYHDIEGISPFWTPQKKLAPGKLDTTKPIRGPQKRYV